MDEKDRDDEMNREKGNGHDVPDENPVGVRKPLIRTIQDVSAPEPQNSAVRKLVDNMIQMVNRMDHMDTDLVGLGASMIRGFAGIESKFEEQIEFLSRKIDTLAGLPIGSSSMTALPPMRRREDSQSAIEDLSRHVSSNVREQAQKIADDPDSTLDPETVTKLAEDAVNKVLAAAKERDRVKALEAEKEARDRAEAEKKEQAKADQARNKDFRRNLTIAIVGAVIAGACAIYAAYMTGHESGHDKGVADALQSVPALSTAVLGVPSAFPPVPAAPAAPAVAPTTVAPAPKK